MARELLNSTRVNVRMMDETAASALMHTVMKVCDVLLKVWMHAVLSLLCDVV